MKFYISAEMFIKSNDSCDGMPWNRRKNTSWSYYNIANLILKVSIEHNNEKQLDFITIKGIHLPPEFLSM